MILVKNRRTRNRIEKKINNKTGRIYVNTLVPQFHFKNKKGEILVPNNVCVNL